MEKTSKVNKGCNPRSITIGLLFVLLAACTEQNTETPSDNQELAKKTKTEKKITSDTKELYQFTDIDIQFLEPFLISNLGEPPKSVSNQYSENIDAAKLGKKLFFDASLSNNKQVSCATCHQPKRYFTDGLAFSKATGVTKRSSPSVLGAAYSPWQFWDGRKDSLWSQALGPIEDHNEYNTSRLTYVRNFLEKYPNEYQNVFGDIKLDQIAQLPKSASPKGNSQEIKNWENMSKTQQDLINQVFSHIGKAIMAYQRQLTIPPSRFDHFLEALVEKREAELPKLLSPQEVKGLRLFVGKANCASCHNGPLFTNYEFHNIGAPDPIDKPVELGRYQGVKDLVEDEFTCLSKWSDASEQDCAEMRFLKTSGPELVGALKTPTLRNIAETAPYMQMGQFENLQQVITHYNFPAPPVYNREQHPNRPHFDILPLKLTTQEVVELESFLHTLTSPLPKDDPWWGLEKDID